MLGYIFLPGGSKKQVCVIQVQIFLFWNTTKHLHCFCTFSNIIQKLVIHLFPLSLFPSSTPHLLQRSLFHGHAGHVRPSAPPYSSMDIFQPRGRAGAQKTILGWSAKFESCWHTNDNCSKHCGWNSVGPVERERKGRAWHLNVGLRRSWQGTELSKAQHHQRVNELEGSRSDVECCTWNRGSCFAFLADGTQAVLWYLHCQTAPNVDSLTPTWIVSIMSWPLFCFSSRNPAWFYCFLCIIALKIVWDS